MDLLPKWLSGEASASSLGDPGIIYSSPVKSYLRFNNEYSSEYPARHLALFGQH